MIESFAALKLIAFVPSFKFAAVSFQAIALKIQFVGVVPSSKLSLIKYVCPKLVAAEARKRAKAAKQPRTEEAAARPIADG